MASGSNTQREDLPDFWTDRNLRFRILILGRANAGKTTILERLTGSSESEAQIWRRENRWGEMELLEGVTVKGQIDRGLHNVEDEVRFPSRPGFVFHDTHGFEAGSVEEFNAVREFVEHRSAQVDNVKKQLHAIWMCLPLDDSRELFDSERDVLKWERGQMPLIIIFTKRDGAIIEAMGELSGGEEDEEGNEQLAEIEVDKAIMQREEELKQINEKGKGTESPLAFLTTSDMEEKTEESIQACEKLVEITESMLSGPRLKSLLYAVWGHNIYKAGKWGFYWLLGKNISDPVNQEVTEEVMVFMIKWLMPMYESEYDFGRHFGLFFGHHDDRFHRGRHFFGHHFRHFHHGFFGGFHHDDHVQNILKSLKPYMSLQLSSDHQHPFIFLIVPAIAVDMIVFAASKTFLEHGSGLIQEHSLSAIATTISNHKDNLTELVSLLSQEVSQVFEAFQFENQTNQTILATNLPLNPSPSGSIHSQSKGVRATIKGFFKKGKAKKKPSNQQDATTNNSPTNTTTNNISTSLNGFLNSLTDRDKEHLADKLTEIAKKHAEVLTKGN